MIKYLKRGIWNVQKINDVNEKSKYDYLTKMGFFETNKNEYDLIMVYINDFNNSIINLSKKSLNGSEKFIDNSDIKLIKFLPNLQYMKDLSASNIKIIKKQIKIWKTNAWDRWSIQYKKDVQIGNKVIQIIQYNNPHRDDVNESFIETLGDALNNNNEFVNGVFTKYTEFGYANNWIQLNNKFDVANNQKIELSLTTFLKLSKLKFSNLLGEISHNSGNDKWVENIPCNDIVVKNNKFEYVAAGKIFVYQNNKWSYTNNGGTSRNLDSKVIRYWYNAPSIKIVKTKINPHNKTITEQINDSIIWLDKHYSILGHVLDKIVNVAFECRDTSVSPLIGYDGLYNIKSYAHVKQELILVNENDKIIYVFKINNVWRISIIGINDTNAGFFEHMFKSAYKCESNKL